MPDINEWVFAFFIILAKVVEVTIATLRMVLVTRGERKAGSILAFMEAIIWCTIVGSVITGLTESPLRLIAYSLGYAIGTYVGSLLEEKLAIGLCEIQVILTEKQGDQVATILRDDGFAVTQIKAKGKVEAREMLILYAKRNKIKHCTEIIKKTEPHAVVTVSDKKPVYGGFGLLKK